MGSNPTACVNEKRNSLNIKVFKLFLFLYLSIKTSLGAYKGAYKSYKKWQHSSRGDVMNTEQELEKEMKAILEFLVYDCEVNEDGRTLKRCEQCANNVGKTIERKIICIKGFDKKMF